MKIIISLRTSIEVNPDDLLVDLPDDASDGDIEDRLHAKVDEAIALARSPARERLHEVELVGFASVVDIALARRRARLAGRTDDIVVRSPDMMFSDRVDEDLDFGAVPADVEPESWHDSVHVDSGSSE